MIVHQYMAVPGRVRGKFHAACLCGWRGIPRSLFHEDHGDSPIAEWRDHELEEQQREQAQRRDTRGHPIYRVKARSAAL